MADADRLQRLEHELGAALLRRNELTYQERQGILADFGKAELAALRETEIPELEEAIAEASGRALDGGGTLRP